MDKRAEPTYHLHFCEKARIREVTKPQSYRDAMGDLVWARYVYAPQWRAGAMRIQLVQHRILQDTEWIREGDRAAPGDAPGCPIVSHCGIGDTSPHDAVMRILDDLGREYEVQAMDLDVAARVADLMTRHGIPWRMEPRSPSGYRVVPV